MLQQTQVDRVLPKYKEFLRAFPTLSTLANASVADVLRVWSGLGYNRRALMLKRASEAVIEAHRGRLPRDVSILETLPGVGAYTARAVACFAFNEPSVFIETNIRTVFIHHYFTPVLHGQLLKETPSVPDAEIIPFIGAALDRENPREWYCALMDYGAYLKKTIGNANRLSKHYTKQSRFEGSNRQVRGAILKLLLSRPHTATELRTLIPRPSESLRQVLDALLREGFVKYRGRRYMLVQ